MINVLDKVGDFLGISNKDEVAAGQNSLDQLMADATSVGQQNRQLYGDYLNRMQGIYGQGAGQYADAVNNLANAIGEGADSFGYTGNVNDFYDKFANQTMQASINAMKNMGGQNLFSSDFMNNLTNRQAALASSQWEKAYDKMMQDRQQQLQEWQAGQTSKQNYLSNLGSLASLYGNDRNQLANAYGDYYSNLASQNNADLQTRADLTSSRTNLGLQADNGFGTLLGAAGTVLGGLAL
jgi:hypothetical protein